MYNTQAKQRIEIDILKQNYNQQQTLFDRDLDQMKIMLQQTEKAKLEANQKYALLSEKYNQKKIVDILDNQSFNKEGTYLFRTAKYAILGLDSQQRDLELPNLTKKIKPQGQNEINFGETFRVKTAISYKQIENEQSKIPVSEENNNISQSIINLMNNLEKQRHIYTTSEKQNEYEAVPQKPIKSEGRSVSVTFDKDVQKNYHLTSEQSQQSQNILDEQIQYIEPQSEDSYLKQQQQEAIDNQIDELLNNIQIIVSQNKKLSDYTATTHKLQQQTERKYIPLIPDKGNSFKPVHFVKEQIVVPDSKILDKNVKDLDNLDKLISDLCN